MYAKLVKVLYNGLIKIVLIHLISVPFLLLLISCTQPLIIKYISTEEPGFYMFGKTKYRNFYENVFLSDSLQKVWQRETKGSQLHNSIAIYNDYLFVSDLSGRIYGYDKNTGKEIGFEKNNGAISVTPIIYKLRLFYVVNNLKERYSTFVMYDFVNGRKINEFKIDGGVNNELLKTENAVFVLSDKGELVKFNYAGEIEWSVDTKSTTKCIPAADENYIIWGNQNGELVFANITDGKIIFREKICDGIESGISIDNNILYLGDVLGKLISFDKNKMTIQWIYKTNAKIKSIPVFNDESVFIGNLSGNIYSINKVSGKRNWIFHTNGIINTTPLLFKNLLIQPDYNKKIHLLNNLTGTSLKTIIFDRRVKLTPVYYEGMLYLGSDRGQIHAYKTFEIK